jgi:hypothetical protein
MNQNAKKTRRMDLLVAEELHERILTLAKQTGKSKNGLINDILWDVALQPSRIYKLCPTCKVPVFNSQEIPVSEGQQVLECLNGHSNLFDFGKDDWA